MRRLLCRVLHGVNVVTDGSRARCARCGRVRAARIGEGWWSA